MPDKQIFNYMKASADFGASSLEDLMEYCNLGGRGRKGKGEGAKRERSSQRERGGGGGDGNQREGAPKGEMRR